MDRPTRKRYLFGFVVAATILAVVGIGVVAAALRSGSGSAMVAHTYDVIGRIQQARALLFDGISSQRNYLLTHDRRYRAQYASARPRLEQHLDALSDLVLDNQAQRQRVTTLRQLVNIRLDAADLNLAIYEERGLQAAQANVRLNHGRLLTQRIDVLIGQMEQAERRLLAQRSESSRRSARLLIVLGALGIPLSLAILGWVYALLGREARERQAAVRATGAANVQLADTVRQLELAGNELQELGRYGSLLQSCRNLPEALDVAQRTLSHLIPGSAGTFYVLRESQDLAEAESGWGSHAASSEPVLAPADCWALRRDQPHVVDDLSHGLACNHVHALTDAEDVPICTVCVPLAAQGVSLGMLYLSAPQAALAPHIATATTAAEQLSLAMANLRLHQTLRHQSIRDPLTGLYNRRYLDESLTRELARCERRGLPLSMMMLDLDHFKALNDRNGHDGGDAVLAAFGRLLQGSCRAEDIACRYGGEEFTLILPEMDTDAALRRAEEIRAAVAHAPVRHLQREIGPVTVSIGLATYPLHATTGAMLKRLADEALYRAKHKGRNRVEIAAD